MARNVSSAYNLTLTLEHLLSDCVPHFVLLCLCHLVFQNMEGSLPPGAPFNSGYWTNVGADQGEAERRQEKRAVGEPCV